MSECFCVESATYPQNAQGTSNARHACAAWQGEHRVPASSDTSRSAHTVRLAVPGCAFCTMPNQLPAWVSQSHQGLLRA